MKDTFVYRATLDKQMNKECHLWLKLEESSISSKDFPRFSDCQTWFPGHDFRRGLVIELLRLNVPCSRGYLHFSGLNATLHQYIRSHKQAHLCGKLEELTQSDRHIYFPASHTSQFLYMHGNPMFAFSYRLVDYCYNMTFIAQNGSFELKPSGNLECTFKIYLPYGNRVALTLHIGDSSSTGTPDTNYDILENNSDNIKCSGLLTELMDGESSWRHCTNPGDAERQIQMLSRQNKVVLKVSLRSFSGSALAFRMFYKAEPVEEITGRCGFGWIALKQFCVTTLETAKLPWAQAEMECTRKGGHLISIRNEHAQKSVDNLLLNSPGYRDHNAYWIGASDKSLEGDFRWTDGLPFSYTNWFPGWSLHNDFSRQPNDDGLSEQDCVEVRRVYSLPNAPARLTSSFMWNDRDCAAPNYFVCERLQSDEPLEDNWPPDCNRSITLSRQQPRTSISSPSFPRPYPDNVVCETDVSAPSGYRLVLDFEELVLESEPACSYDYLEILENFPANLSSVNNSTPGRRLCGDWSTKLKLLRYVSKGSKLRLRFSSDYSHHFGGYKARISMENVMQCSDDRLVMFNNSCYLIVSYPEVTWSTAQQICIGIKAQLTSVLSPEEEKFITTNIRRSSEYRTSALYWYGARSTTNGKFYWVDGNEMSYSGWISSNFPEETNALTNSLCLGVQWLPQPIPTLPSGFYWKSLKCDAVGGYVCKRQDHAVGQGINFNNTLKGTEGRLTTPNYPGYYYNNLDFFVKIKGPERTRIVIHFDRLDLEGQIDCLYDYVRLKGWAKRKNEAKWCGSYDTDMHRFDFVSEHNEAEVQFHSDYSISGSGFSLTWNAVDVSACPIQTLTSKEGVITSPNYPNFLLPHLDCSITILAPAGKRVWLEFEDFNFESRPHSSKHDNYAAELLQIVLGNESPAFSPFQVHTILTEGAFISDNERLQITLRTGEKPNGSGFRAIYKTIAIVEEERVINLFNDTVGNLLHLNFPSQPSQRINFIQHFVAPIGHVVLLEIFNVELSKNDCFYSNGVIEIYDKYADKNGTKWNMCERKFEHASLPESPVSISSYLNTLHLRQRSNDFGIKLNATLKVKVDVNYHSKLLKLRDADVEFCNPNPCLNDGKCVINGNKQVCKCSGHFAGLFCALTLCEFEPCVFGRCVLTATSYKCTCKAGYIGSNCDQKQRPCEGNPCESRGLCIEKDNGFSCRCHAWWEGSRCERRMLRIPYKPLSQRMLEEPFWLGLITVTIVMSVIGLVWCAKRHFPEKIEKLLAEDSEHGRSSLPSLRTSLREQLAASGGSAIAVTPSPGPGAPRSLFGRLGIRKPSILSLTSPRANGYSPATARTFSLDDLLKPPRRTPSPRKKRNNSTPTKKNAAEKKQILQQLVAPSTNRHSPHKVNLGDLIQLSETKRQQRLDDQYKETKLTLDNPSIVLNDPKLEKKVTFARLLNKVSAEMSSGSEMELGIMHANRLGCVFARPSSTPPSPAADARSPHSTSSNQGSDTFSSSDLAIPSAFSCSITDLLNSRKHSKLPNGKQKPASADSILAMFRNFSSSSAGINISSSLKVSPSTTPTASSPQDDVAGDDDSSTSSIHTPISFSSGAPESPILYRQSAGTIEVPVLDMLSAHKSPGCGANLLHPPTILLEIPSTINKCLSPIREMPTPLPSPMPSPAFTPIMHRSTASSSINDISIDSTSDDRISIEIPNISISEEDDILCTTDIGAYDPHAEDGLILEEAAVMHQAPQFKMKVWSNPLVSPNIRPPSIVIPTLTVQTPSPTHPRTPPHLLGSPPPRHECENYSWTPAPNKHALKVYRDIEKPTSLALHCNPPMITITCNVSEAESDLDAISPCPKNTDRSHASVIGGMCYLSPFSMGSRADRTASESNLSSSGYSSMTSPGPSRCGSSNPLCPSEMEDPGSSGPGSSNLHGSLGRRTIPLMKLSASPQSTNKTNNSKNQQRCSRERSDSETFSDDPLIESNDEGIGTDHLDEKIEDGELKSAKELEVFITHECDSTNVLSDLTSITSLLSPHITKCISLEANMDRLMPPSSASCKTSLQLPSIVVQNECSVAFEKHLSPMSSRSESPLSDKTLGIDRFSPQFYGGNKDTLPFTDSDGLYDFPSTDKVNVPSVSQHHRKSIGRRREKKCSRSTKLSPTRNPVQCHLSVPGKESLKECNGAQHRKPSPKRRIRTQQLFSSSSSSESITSVRDTKYYSSTSSPDTFKWLSLIDWPKSKEPRSLEASAEETGDERHGVVHPKSMEELPKLQRKTSRLRAVSNQIRFLRRLENTLNRKGRLISHCDSIESGEDSPRATSPLLQRTSKTEIRKSSSIGKLQPNVKQKRAKYKKGELLLNQHDRSNWKRVVTTGNGYSD